MPWPGPAPAELADGSLVISVMAPRAGVVVVRAVGEIDLLTAAAWRRTLCGSVSIAGSATPPAPVTTRPPSSPGIATHRARRVVCDLSAVTYLGATGLGVLVDLTVHAADCGVELCVVTDDHGPLRRLLRLTGLDRRIAVQPQLGHAVSGALPGQVTPTRAAS